MGEWTEATLGEGEWTEATLGEVAQWFSGMTPKAGNAEYYAGGDIPWATIGDLQDRPISNTETKLTKAGAAVIGRLAPVGAVLVSMYGTIGRTGLATTVMATNQAVAWGVPDKSRCSSEFLFTLMQSLRPRLDSLGRGATQRNINRQILREQVVRLPLLREQTRIVDVVAAVDGQIDMLAKEIEAASQVARALRRTVFTTLDAKAVMAGEMFDMLLGRHSAGLCG